MKTAMVFMDCHSFPSFPAAAQNTPAFSQTLGAIIYELCLFLPNHRSSPYLDSRRPFFSLIFLFLYFHLPSFQTIFFCSSFCFYLFMHCLFCLDQPPAFAGTRPLAPGIPWPLLQALCVMTGTGDTTTL